MKSLVQILHNKKEDTYHPIFYFEAPFPGGKQLPDNYIRYKSKGTPHLLDLHLIDLAVRRCSQ